MNRSLKPRFALEVAMFGNRHFAKPPARKKTADPEVEARMRKQAGQGCAAVWEVIVDTMRQTLDRTFEVSADTYHGFGHSSSHRAMWQFFSSESPRLGILSGLAGGADQIGVQAARAVEQQQVEKEVDGWPAPKVQVELEAILPFPAEDYPGLPGKRRKEFSDDEARTLEELTQSAELVLRLDGSYAPLSDTVEASESRRRAYRQGRDLALLNCDLLVASFNPEREGKAAGTLETISHALEAGIPVVAVLVAENETRIAIYTTPADRPSADEWNKAKPLNDQTWRPQLAERLQYLLCLPHMLDPSEPEEKFESEKRGKNLARTVARLDMFYGETDTPFTCRCPVRGPMFDFAWHAILDLGARFARPHGFTKVEKPDDGSDVVTIEPYAKYYDRASELSWNFMRVYRGGFVLAFLLAGVAVTAAVALLAISWIHASVEVDPRLTVPLWVICTLGGLKIGVLLFLLQLERDSHHHHYQEQATDFRYLAELLRPMQWLAPLATFTPSTELPAHYAPLDPRQSWTTWLFRAIGRSTTCVPGSEKVVNFSRTVATNALVEAREWVQGQISYHWGLAQRMHGIENGLESVAKGLLKIVLVCALLALGLEIAHHYSHAKHAASGEHSAEVKKVVTVKKIVYMNKASNAEQASREKAVSHEKVDSLGAVDFRIPILGAFAAALPAFIAALAGIMFQSEAKRLELRSESMFHGLRRQSDALDKAIKELQEQSAISGGKTWEAAVYLRKLAEGMMIETSEWKALYQMHEIRAG